MSVVDHIFSDLHSTPLQKKSGLQNLTEYPHNMCGLTRVRNQGWKRPSGGMFEGSIKVEKTKNNNIQGRTKPR